MSEGDERLERLIGSLAAAHRRAHEPERPARHARMRAAVLERTQARGATTPRPRRWAWGLGVGGLLAGALLAGALVLWLAGRAGPSRLAVDASLGGQASVFLAARDDRPLTVSLADGGTLTLQPRARARVHAPRDAAASVVLEAGALEVALASPAPRAWPIAAGPYQVEVRSGVLWVEWQPQQGALELDAREGEARVWGPRLDGIQRLSGGDRLVILGERAPGAPATGDGLVAREVTVEVEAAETAETAETAEPPRSSSPIEPAEPARALDDRGEQPPSRGHRRQPSPEPRPVAERGPEPEPTADEAATWRDLAREGAHAEAMAAAEAAGFDDLCDSLDAAALLDLADAARYAGRMPQAAEALHALRRRFPRTDAAAAAAFDLGRLETRCEAAARWLRAYLDERPDGPMAEAARRRLDGCAKAGAAGGAGRPR